MYFNETLRIFVEMPLKAPGRYFNAFRALPLPYSENYKTKLYIEPESQFLTVLEDGQYYFTLDSPNLFECKSGSIKMCPPYRPVHRMTDVSCLTALYTGDAATFQKICKLKITNDNRSVRHRTKYANTWIFSVDKDVLALNCPITNALKINITTKIITGTGIVTVPASCIVHSKNYFLPSYTITTSKISYVLDSIVIPTSDVNISRLSNFALKSGTTEEINVNFKSKRQSLVLEKNMDVY